MALNLVIDYIDTSKQISEKDISDYLLKTGFDDNDVRQILTVLDINGFDSGAFRVFTKKEKKVFTEEAMNYIQKMNISGILDMISLETVIEAASEEDGGYRVDIEQVKNHVLYALMERNSLFSEEDEPRDEYVN